MYGIHKDSTQHMERMKGEREHCCLWQQARNVRLKGRAGGCFPKSDDKNVTEARCAVDVLLQLLRHVFEISTTILEFNRCLTCFPNNFNFQKVQDEMKEVLTPDSSLSKKEDFVGDVCMIEIFQQTYEIKCGLCLPENEKKGSCHPRICIGRVGVGEDLWS